MAARGRLGLRSPCLCLLVKRLPHVFYVAFVRCQRSRPELKIFHGAPDQKFPSLLLGRTSRAHTAPTASPSHFKLTTKQEVCEMKAAPTKAVVARLVAALLGVGSQALAEPSKKEGLVSKYDARYTLFFINDTGSDITLARMSEICMRDAGPASYTVRNGMKGYFNLADSDDSRGGCKGALKSVIWRLSNGTTLQWRHEIQAGSGQTQVQGQVQSAGCDDQNCLAPAYVGDDHATPIVIKF